MKTEPSETKRLADALAGLATVIAEIVESRLRETAVQRKPFIDETNTQFKHGGNGEAWVKKKEIAEHLGISLRTVNYWMRRGELPYVRMGRAIRFKISLIDETLRRRTRGGLDH